MTDAIGRLTSALADRYRIDGELGAGGMATVYRATDLRHDRTVALKVLRPELAAVLGGDRFLQEIRIAAQLDHPHILTLIDSGAADGFLYYVLPYVRGESLRQKLDRETQLEMDEALAITQQVGSALDYAHRQGVVHRDIKPENILLQEGEAMLADFGIALAVREAGGNRLTESGMSLGTPQYMSPEQAAGDRQLDARSDVYSLGAVLYEMLAGDPPHTGATVQAVIAKLMTEQPTRLRVLRDTVPVAVDQAVAKALAKVPADRYSSAGAFLAALHAPAPSTRTAALTRRAAFLAVAGFTVLAAAVAAGVFLSRHPTAAPTVGYDRVRITSTGDAAFAIVSPDGRQVAYTDFQSPETGARRARIVVQDVATGARRVIADSAQEMSLERWSPSGSWLRLSLIAVGTGKPAGEYVVPSLGGPMTYVGAGVSDFLPADDSMLVASDSNVKKGRDTQLHLVALPANQPLDSVAIAPPPGALSLSTLAVAPNGRTLAIVWQRARGGMLLAIYDRSGALRDTTSKGLITGVPWTWSPASDALFLPVVSTENRLELLRVGVNATTGRFGSRDTLMVAPAGESFNYHYVLSANGHSLVYTSGQTGEWKLWTLERPTSSWPPRRGRRVQSSSVGIFGEVSRNGRDIYFQLEEGGSRVQLFVAPFDSGESRAVTPILTGTGSWQQTLDGRRLIVETAQGPGHGRLTAYDVATGRAAPFGPDLPSEDYAIQEAGLDGVVLINPARDTLLVLDGSGHEQRRIAIPDSLGAISTADPSPDASELSFVAFRPEAPLAEDGSREVQFYRVSLVTGKIRLFNRVRVLTLLSSYLFRWTADGSVHVLMRPPGAPRTMLYRVPLDGGPPVLEGKLPFAPDFCDCDMSSDGRRWTGIVASTIYDIYLIRNFDPRKP